VAEIVIRDASEEVLFQKHATLGRVGLDRIQKARGCDCKYRLISRAAPFFNAYELIWTKRQTSDCSIC